MHFSCPRIQSAVRLVSTIVVLAVITGGCRTKKTTPEDSSQQLESLISLKNRSIAMLENAAEVDREGILLAESADAFRTLIQRFPRDPLGYQNLCVNLLFSIKQAAGRDEPMAEELRSEFLKTVEVLQALTPSKSDGFELEGRFHIEQADFPEAIRLFRVASQKPSASAATIFQLIELLQSEDPTKVAAEVEQLLDRASNLAPNSLVLAVAKMAQLIEKQDSAGAKLQLQQCQQLLAPVMARTSGPVERIVSELESAVESSDWRSAQTRVVFLRNLLMAELVYQTDLHLLRPHSLDFVLIHFEQPLKIAGTSEEPLQIQFEAIDSKIEIDGRITAIACEDINLDGRFDLVVAHPDSIVALSLDPGQENPLILSHSLDWECSGIALADLDRDYQYRKGTLPASPLPSTHPIDSPEDSSPAFVDTDLDFILYGQAGIRLMENYLDPETGLRSLKERPVAEGLERLTGIRTLAVIDMDHDADLDLAISSEQGVTLWSNRGDWTFADFTEFSQLPDPQQPIRSILALDADRNVLNDFLLGTDQSPLPIMLSNNLHGRYHIRDIYWPELAGSCLAVEAIDVNSDACWDIVTCGSRGTFLLTMKSVGNKNWSPAEVRQLSKRPMQGLLTGDFNNDGFVDCFVWGNEGAEIFYGTQDGQMVKHVEPIPVRSPILSAIAMDFDDDGDDDLICLTQDGTLVWLENRGGNNNHHLDVVLRADEDGSQRPRERSNMHGVGSLIELKSNGSYQARIVRGTRTRFGVGQTPSVDVMRVVWTNGVPNNVLNVESHSTIYDQQDLLGSCPYLYTWNGEKFQFYTDCLWAAPIGLQFAPGVTAPTREWEYLKIDGQALQPLDGQYVMQITEELWEAAYFDAVELIAVDHPADIEIYSNEKVGPADLAEFKIYTVSDRRLPNTVTDKRGNDLRELTSVKDQRYTKTWTQGLNQGLTETHWVELDLNRSDCSSDEIVLFMTGWLFPTSTSINMAMAENPLRPQLQPPSVWVPDESGEWVQTIPHAGFPGGKTKTIAIDLKGSFLCEDQRVRIVSNMELCWDEIFYTVDEREAAADSFRLTPLKLVGADLNYRGFSKRIARPGNASKYYDYDQVERQSVWPPMTGAFTRYGDVTELIESADDRMAILGAGDEMTVRFAADDSPLPAGWVRDFLLYNVGYDKDADLNTIHGQDVEPLPFRAMERYPYGPDQQFPDTPLHREYLQKYQTRYQNAPLFWNQIRDATESESGHER